MASKRVALSAVNWTAISQRVPAKQREAFNLLKNTSDKYVNRIQELPENLPKIDFADYKAKLPGLSAMVTEFEKQYAGVQIPYPKDSTNMKSTLQKEEVMVRERSANYIERETKHLHNLQTLLKKIETIPPPEKMTVQMFNHYFPEDAINPNRENPGFWPHLDDKFQLHNLRKVGRSLVYIQDPVNFRVNSDSYEEFELYWLEKVCEWEAEEMEPKFQAILEGYQKLVDEAMEEEIEKIQNKDGDEGVKAFIEDEEAQKALKQKVLAANGITKEKFFNDAEKVVGRLRELKTLKDFMDALEEK